MVNCPFCGSEMMLKQRSIHESMLNGVTYHARDELYKCPKCYYVATFGVPITKEEYEEELKKWGGRMERVENEEVMERLKSLGYL